MKYHIEKITGDNRRPEMEHHAGYLIRYRLHPQFGWTGCKTVATLEDAEAFASTLTAEGDLPEEGRK